MSNIDMSVSIGSLHLANPIMSASGTFSEDYHQAIDFNKLGALVTKSITPNKRMGNKGPRIAETTAGMINAVGIQSKGIDAFISKSIPFYQQFSSPLIVSISADTSTDFARLAKQLTIDGVAALEVNISCPNLEDSGKSYAMDPVQTYKVMKEVRAATHLPLLAKLTPNTSNITEVAKAAEKAGSDALVVANTILAMAIDVETRKPKVGNVMGGLSGPAIKPIIVRMVYQVAQAVNIPIIGCGGVSSAYDALEYMIAGASAVQVGTYSFVHPTGMLDILDGMTEYAQRHGISKITDLVGTTIVDRGINLKNVEAKI
jgi:dihydroorotate dehydrogenase (NAD+) catalytic subunit